MSRAEQRDAHPGGEQRHGEHGGHGEHGEHAHGGHGHRHVVRGDADRRWLTAALLLIAGFMAVEVVVGLLAGSLVLLGDAGHMLTDAAAILLALIAVRLAARPAAGGYTYGLTRAEILSAQANGITLLVLAVVFVVSAVRRLVDPPPVAGIAVLVTALAGIVVNIAAAWCLARADRSSLNVQGAFQHVLNDLYGFIATALAGAVIWLTGFQRADPIATLLVAALMVRAGWGLVRESGRIFLEAAPPGTDPDLVGARLAGLPHVVEVHDLHIWLITSGRPALSAHVLVDPGADCHGVRAAIERVLADGYGLHHTTLQVDHARVPPGPAPLPLTPRRRAGRSAGVPDPGHCADAHGVVHRAP
jgi:cobalt-zinc-cadmium efflux system protein